MTFRKFLFPQYGFLIGAFAMLIDTLVIVNAHWMEAIKYLHLLSPVLIRGTDDEVHFILTLKKLS